MCETLEWRKLENYIHDADWMILILNDGNVYRTVTRFKKRLCLSFNYDVISTQ